MEAIATYKHHSTSGDLALKFQPIINTYNENILCYEALLHIENCALSIEDIIIALEKNDLIKELDLRVVSTMDQYMVLHQAHCFSINISPNSIVDENNAKYLLSQLKKFNHPERLVLEITETSVKRDFKLISSFVDSVRSLGLKIAIDDFCSGYTSFQDLLHLNIDIIKLDCSVVNNLTEKSIAVIRMICDYADKFNIEVIAECIETLSLVKKLQTMNIKYMQGYYTSSLKNVEKLPEIKLI